MMNGTKWKFGSSCIVDATAGSAYSATWWAVSDEYNTPFVKRISDGKLAGRIEVIGTAPNITPSFLGCNGFEFSAGLEIEIVHEPDLTGTGLTEFVNWLNLNATQIDDPSYIVKGSQLSGLANTIRIKTGESDSIEFPDGFAEEILEIQTGYDTSDATATASDIKSGKSAYGPSGKINGSYNPPTWTTVTKKLPANEITAVPPGQLALLGTVVSSSDLADGIKDLTGQQYFKMSSGAIVAYFYNGTSATLGILAESFTYTYKKMST